MAATQADAPLRMESTLGADSLLIREFHGEEGLSRLFRYHLEVATEQASLDLASLLRQPVKVFLQLPDHTERCFHGMVAHVAESGFREGMALMRLELVPWLWFLTLNHDCRIFQSKTVPEILQAVFNAAGGSGKYTLELQRTYPQREYCVQYRESDFAFVSRLMEEEGIFYFFEHSPQGHQLVLADAIAAHQPCPGQPTASCQPAGGGNRGEDIVESMERVMSVHTGKVSLTDYNFESPNTSLAVTEQGEQPNEEYDYPGNYRVRGDGTTYAKLRLEAEEARLLTVYGEGTCRAFTPGYKFDLTDHYREAANQSYTLVSVAHEIRAAALRAGAPGGFDYRNRFTVIPNATVYRPPRLTPRPRVAGAQTAVVTGPAGEEIYTDQYGRVKVHFFWDRVGQRNETSSCWMRVSHAWAGKAWGQIQLPRIGQEVIVSFLEGDPDRPIVTGRVYNADQTVPYALPANMTQSGVKSRSTLRGGTANFNEFRFEDKKGEEQVYFHAEKNLDSHVENDETRYVGHDRTTTIQNHETKTVKDGNETITLEKGDQTQTLKLGSQTETIQQDQTLTLKMGNRTVTLDMGNQSTTLKMGNQTTKLNLGKSEHEAMQSIELKVGASSVKVDQMGVTIKGMMIKIEGTVMVEVKGLMTQVNGSAMLICKGGITMIN